MSFTYDVRESVGGAKQAVTIRQHANDNSKEKRMIQLHVGTHD